MSVNTDIEPEGSDAVRIAMWSGPRNISTALMRSWGSRPDTYVCDEPLYACYLLTTGRDHPGRAEILREHDTDPDRVIRWLTGKVPEGKRIFYQKQMSQNVGVVRTSPSSEARRAGREA